MKKLCFLCALCLCFAACGRESADMGVEEAAERVMAEYERNAFVRADEDFMEANFGAPDYVTESAVYYAQNGDDTEFGFFRLSDAKYGADMEKIIQTYIQSERESVEALAALYPAEELSARLARFDGATVNTVGLTTYYVIADAKTVKKTENLFKN